jgi:hypothetical protein
MRAMSADTIREYDHERSDVAPRWPILIGVGVLLMLPITVALVAALLNSIWAPPVHPVSGPQVEAPSLGANVVHLQIDPQGDLAALRDKWNRQLHSTGWIDREAGIVHVPISQAKRLLVENGLPDDTRQPPPSRAADPGDNAGVVDRAGNGAARPARNRPDRSAAVPYREDEMTP